MRISEDVVSALRVKFEAVLPHLDERSVRLVLAGEARSLGYGGLTAVAQASGASKSRIAQGMTELESGQLAASLCVDSVVHDNGDSGSPRLVGSTRPSSAGRRPGSVSVIGLRPPPSRLTRPAGANWPDSNSVIPCAILDFDDPDACATAVRPPYPSDRASP